MRSGNGACETRAWRCCYDKPAEGDVNPQARGRSSGQTKRMRRFHFPSLVATAAWLSVCTCAADGCSDDPSTASDAGDASVLLPEAEMPDATSEDGPDACACIADDAASKATMSLPCFCATSTWCSSSRYDDVTRCSSGGVPPSIETYTACNYVTVRIKSILFERTRVYDATTHELVGLFLADDTPRFECGAARTLRIQAGVDPIAEGCQVAKTEGCVEGGIVADGGGAGGGG